MSEQDRPAPKRRSCMQSCGTGCVGIFIVGALVFAIAFSMTGHYKPKIDPLRPLPANNGFDDFAGAGKTFAANGGTKAAYLTTGVSESDISLEVEKGLVAANQPALAQLRSGVGKEAQVPVQRSFTATYPYLAEGRDLARLLNADADVHAAAGDHAGAMNVALDGYEMGQGLTNGGLLIHGLVLVAIESILSRQLVSNTEKLSEPECKLIAARMQKILLRQPQAGAIMREERNALLTNLAQIDDIRQLTSSGTNYDVEAKDNPTQFPVEKVLGGVAWHFMRDQALSEIDRYCSRALQELNSPSSKRLRIPEPRSPIAQMLVPVFAGAPDRFDANEVSNRIILCAISIRGYRLQHGALPKSLDNLGIEPRLLIDPCTGEKLIYRPAGSDYLLYSVGPDGKDGGGVPADSSQTPIVGDLGIQPFRKPSNQNRAGRWYRRVPHMRPPVLSPNAPTLKE